MAEQRLGGAGWSPRVALAPGGVDQAHQLVVGAARESGGARGALVDQLRAPLLGEVKRLRVGGSRVARRLELMGEGLEIGAAEVARERAFGAPPRDRRCHRARSFDRRSQLVV